ncbi:MAG: carbohydrate-binding family 9-like protein [Alphaproteobacteria bacterium]|nr:carbohydrate-binding family 9-like protein [Alphaproteobacteria bacterium]
MKKYVILLLAALPAVLPAPPAWAQGQTPALAERSNLPPIPSYEVHRAKTAPSIDGRLDDTAWADARPVTFIFPWENQTGKKQKTTARLLWDNDNLYVAYDCEDSDITATRTERDQPTYMDDAVEIFIGPPGVKNLYLGLEMNARGALYDYLYPFPQRFIKNYNLPGVRIATSMRGTLNNSADQDQGWSLEVAIPWRAFADLIDNPVPKTGDHWIADMNRWDGTRSDRVLSQWSDSGLVRADPHYPDRFGQLVFLE